MKKLPLITLLFWVLKVAATTLGETLGDTFSMTLHIGYGLSTLLLLAGFLGALSAQLKTQAYRPILYWSVILFTSTAGTTLSDFLDRSLRLGYLKGSLLLVLSLAGILSFWRIRLGTLSLDRVNGRGPELLYWMTILISNTLGTALGDFLADDSGLGFSGGALCIGSLIGVCILLYRFTGISRILLFWVAFILTRPFGATLGDFLQKEQGGLALGSAGSSLILALILVLGLWVSIRKKSLAP